MKLHLAALTLVLIMAFQVGCGGMAQQLKKDERQTVREASDRYENDNWQERLSAVRDLKGFRGRAAEELLIKALDDGHTLVRIEALRSLKGTASSKTWRRIRTIAEYEPNENVRWQAIKVLAGFRDARDAVVFAKGLSSKDWLIREESVKGLLTIEDYAIRYVSIPYILQALEDPDIKVRLAAIENLSIRDERIYKSLASMLEGDVVVKYTLLKALLKALVGYRLDDLTLKRVRDLVVHQNAEIRVLALRLLKSDGELKKHGH